MGVTQEFIENNETVVLQLIVLAIFWHICHAHLAQWNENVEKKTHKKKQTLNEQKI